MSRHESIRALRRANPRNADDHDGALPELDGLRDRVVASPARAARRPQTPVRVRVAWAGAIAVVVVGVAVAFALTAPTPSGKGGGVVPNAYAAVAKAMADTAAAAKSGTIETSMRADWPERPAPKLETSSLPEPERREAEEINRRGTLPATHLRLATTFKWNGNDMSLLVGTEDGGKTRTDESRYVDGVYYQQWDKTAPGEEPSKVLWVRLPAGSSDEPVRAGTASYADNPEEWVKAARSDVTGANLRRIISATKGLARKANDDGSITYSGTATAGAVKADSLSVTGLPTISQPILKVQDMSTPVVVSVTVGSDGLIREVRCSYETDGGKWEYRSTYRDLGRTGEIAAPPASDVTDPPSGKGGRG